MYLLFVKDICEVSNLFRFLQEVYVDGPKVGSLPVLCSASGGYFDRLQYHSAWECRLPSIHSKAS